MWDYIMESIWQKQCKEYKTVIAVTACSLVLPFIFGCAGIDELNRASPGEPYSWLTDEERAAQQSSQVIVIRDHSLSDSIHELERHNRQMALENSLRIRRMQLELKRREAERKLQEFYRQRNR